MIMKGDKRMNTEELKQQEEIHADKNKERGEWITSVLYA